MSEYIVRLPIGSTTDVFMKVTGEIVRCSDCKWYIGANSLTGWNDVCNLTDSNVQPNGYCAWGKQKEESE